MNVDLTEDQIQLLLSHVEQYLNDIEGKPAPDDLASVIEIRRELLSNSQKLCGRCYCHEAEESLDLAKLYLNKSIKHLSKVVIDDVEGSHQYKSSYMMQLIATMADLIAIKVKGF